MLKLHDGRRVAVLGDMLELGEHGPAMHEALAAEVAQSADVVHTVGPLMGGMWHLLPDRLRGQAAEDVASLAASLPMSLRAGDAVLVKGSLGMRMASLISALDAPS